MRIAIFNHPFCDFYTSPARLTPGILNFLAGLLPQHETMCFDVVKQYKTPIKLPAGLSYLGPYMLDDVSGYSFFSGFHRFGRADNFNHKEFSSFNPELILISSFAWCYAEGLIEMVDYLKSISSAPIAVGGGGPSANPDYYRTHSRADFVEPGPAEEVLPRLLQHLTAPTSRPNACDHTEPCSAEGGPLMPFYSINRSTKRRKLQLVLTRGCPKHCSYCTVHLTAGSGHTRVDAALLEELLRELKLHYSFTEIDFEDDNLSIDRRYFLTVLSTVRRHFPEAKISFENGIDFTTLDNELLEELARYNIKQYNLSFTSVSNSVLQSSGRTYTSEVFDGRIDSIVRTGTPVTAYFIAGLPGDTVDSIYESLMHLASRNVLPCISPFYAVPGTPAFTMIDKAYTRTPLQALATSFNGYGILSQHEKVGLFMLTRFINACTRCRSQEKPAPLTVRGIEASIRNKRITAVRKDGRECVYPLPEELCERFFSDFRSEWLLGT